jgi:hypothetical protein
VPKHKRLHPKQKGPMSVPVRVPGEIRCSACGTPLSRPQMYGVRVETLNIKCQCGAINQFKNVQF